MRRISTKKLARVLRYSLVSVSLIFFVIIFFSIYFSALPDDADFETKLEAFGPGIDIILSWAYILMIVAILASLIFPVIKLIKHPENSLKSLIGVGVFVVVLGIAFLLSDGTPLKLSAYSGTDNTPGILKLADTLLYTALFLIILAFLSILFSEIRKLLK